MPTTILSLTPRDVGFDVRLLGLPITLPIEPECLSVRFIDQHGHEATVTGGPEDVARVLRMSGLAVKLSSRREDQP